MAVWHGGTTHRSTSLSHQLVSMLRMTMMETLNRWMRAVSGAALATLLSVSLLACSTPAPGPQSFQVGLWGDSGYNAFEKQALPGLMAEMNRAPLAFVVHDGDFKSGSSPCTDAAFQEALDLFQTSAHPLIYVPGDNDWTDCHRPAAGRFDPLERLTQLREMFFNGPTSLGQRTLQLERQSDQAARHPEWAAYRENVRWVHGGVLFVGLNLPGSDNNFDGAQRGSGPSAEYLARLPVNRAWVAQAFELARTQHLAGLMLIIQANPEIEAFNQGKGHVAYREFLTQLRDETHRWGKPVVLVHGDSHQQQINQPLQDAQGQTLRNFTRVETYGSPFMGWTRVTVDPQSPRVFSFEPRAYSPSR